jgi:hypothetical protein
MVTLFVLTLSEVKAADARVCRKVNFPTESSFNCFEPLGSFGLIFREPLEGKIIGTLVLAWRIFKNSAKTYKCSDIGHSLKNFVSQPGTTQDLGIFATESKQ